MSTVRRCHVTFIIVTSTQTHFLISLSRKMNEIRNNLDVIRTSNQSPTADCQLPYSACIAITQVTPVILQQEMNNQWSYDLINTTENCLKHAKIWTEVSDIVMSGKNVSPIKVKVKENQSTCIAPCMVHTTLKHSDMDHTAFNLQRTPCLPLPRKRSPDGASTECGGEHLIAAHYSFIDPERIKGWVGLVGWPIADGLPT